MHRPHLMLQFHRFFPLLGLLLLLGACQGSPAATQTAATSSAPPPAPPTSAPLAPTQAPPAAAPPTAAQPTSAPAPTAAPRPTAAAPAAVLPAPVYFLDSGQIWRMERDGRTRRQLTFESAPVVIFDVGATDNALAYVVGESSERTMVLLDASGRTEIIRGPVWGPRIAPAGDPIAFQIEQPMNGSDTGVWTIARSGGRPSVIQASDPIPDPNSPPDNARQYYPLAWSPDGTRLLLGVYFPVGEGGFLAVKNIATGSIVDIKLCCETAWSADGSSIIVAGGTQVQDAMLGLWRADPSTGKTTDLIPGIAEKAYPLVTAARQLGDGNVYAFLAIVKEPSADGHDKVAPAQVQGGRVVYLRKASYLLAGALWAADASGALIADAGANPGDSAGTLIWLPIDGSGIPTDGGAAVELAGRGGMLRWGNTSPQPTPDACDRYRPIAWDAPASRKARPEVLDVQRRLLALGYSQVGAADGFYGDQTREAVRAFQQTNGLPASGDVDCATWGALLGISSAS